MRSPAPRENCLLPREKRLLLIVLVLAFLVKFTPSILQNTQGQNLEAIRSHISKTHPQWQEFQHQQPGFQSVHLFDYTGGDGMFGAWGQVPSPDHLIELRKFMESTLPPRPVYLGMVQVMDPESIELVKKGKNVEPANATDGIQAVRSEVIRKSAPPASRR